MGETRNHGDPTSARSSPSRAPKHDPNGHGRDIPEPDSAQPGTERHVWQERQRARRRAREVPVREGVDLDKPERRAGSGPDDVVTSSGRGGVS